jgi:hypothetical protein
MVHDDNVYAPSAVAVASILPRLSRPFSLHGKCATGMTKKL